MGLSKHPSVDVRKWTRTCNDYIDDIRPVCAHFADVDDVGQARAQVKRPWVGPDEIVQSALHALHDQTRWVTSLADAKRNNADDSIMAQSEVGARLPSVVCTTSHMHRDSGQSGSFNRSESPAQVSLDESHRNGVHTCRRVVTVVLMRAGCTTRSQQTGHRRSQKFERSTLKKNSSTKQTRG